MRSALMPLAALGILLSVGPARAETTVSVCIGNQGGLVTRNNFEVNQGSGYQSVRRESLWATQKACQDIPASARSVKLTIEVLNAVGNYFTSCVREYTPPRALSLYISGTIFSQSCREG